MQTMGPARIGHSDDYVEYCRETARRVRTLHDLALRGRGKEESTRKIHERIVEAVGLEADDDLVDIGCGDGTLLRMAKRIGTRSALGLLATDEEVGLLRKSGLEVKQGFTHSLPVGDESASVVVCNNVLLVVPQDKIPASLREMNRVARPGARIFIGEIPFVISHGVDPKFASGSETLAYLYRTYGARTWLGMARRMAYWRLMGKPPLIIDGTKTSFCASAEEFIAMAEASGLRLERYWRHDDPDTRNNYLFRKAS
jgi:ubiquinone/menaquinone biosynthesis C-methylase UbiE